MPNTFVKIASVTVGAGGSSTIDFQNIPATYTDLTLKYSLRGTTENTSYIFIKFNNNTSNQSLRSVQGSGSAASSFTFASTLQDLAGQNPYSYTASVFNNAEMYIPNYLSSNNKSFSIDSVIENNATANYCVLSAGLWSNTSAINRITLTSGTTDTFAQYSTATLYGIKSS